MARRRPDGRADHDEQRYVYASSDGSSSLTVELDVTAAPTARVLDQDGAVLVRWGG